MELPDSARSHDTPAVPVDHAPTSRRAVPSNAVVPPTYSAFFAASAGVAGALIGLLFVAISVSPQWSDPARRVETDLRAGRAFSALLDALTVSLFALIPGIDLGAVALVVACSGVASCLALGIILHRAERVDGRGRQFRMLAVQGVLFVYQGVTGVQLMRDTHDAGFVQTLAILTVVFFLVGIGRAWQLIGARDNGLFGTILGALAARSGAPPAPGPAAQED